MKIFTKDILDKLTANGMLRLNNPDCSTQFKPVIKLFMPDGGATWLLSEIYPDDHSLAFGLCDMGNGMPELGDVRISDIMAIRGGLGLPVERDIHFVANKTLVEYANAARALGSIQD